MEVGKTIQAPNNISIQKSFNSLSGEQQRNFDNDIQMDDQIQNNNSAYEETQTNQNGFFADTKTAAACSVRVALRVRPLIGRELYESPNICVTCYPESNQLIIGKDRAFTFDQVFDIGTQQRDVFEMCVKNLVLGCFQGYNATVLAYGQTGSGKTHTMGSGYTIGLRDEELGIIPRVIRLIFDEVEKRKQKAEFIIKCSFLEIYNEELNDLLDHGSISSTQGTAAVIDRFMQKKEIAIREEKNGNISVYGLKEEKVNCYEELAACLDKGSNFRSTASTLMNNCSSRSHAIFTIIIEQHIIEDLYKPTTDTQPIQSEAQPSDEFMVAKFHFVDLAGSERAKRTGATGTTLKEGISINKGLLALGNVISALTEENKKGHIPYRDSKLTRILQDSLGGNSRTSMIACVSPAEINFEETLNTLKYASRARNIKNKPIVNRDPNSAQIAQLRQQVYELSKELQSCRKLLISNNIEFEQQFILNDADINNAATSNSSQHKEFALGAQEIQRYESEIRDLKIDRSQKEKKLAQIQVQYDTVKDQLSQREVEYFAIQKERDIARFQLEQITSVLKKRNLFYDIMNEIHGYDVSQQLSNMEIDEGENKKQENQQYDYFFGSSGPCILEEYQVKVEEQKKELSEKVQLINTQQKDLEMLYEQAQQDTKRLEQKEEEIERLKRSVNKLQKENIQIKNDQRKTNRGGSIPISNQVTKRPSTSIGIERKSTLVKKEGANNQWLPQELEYNIKHFNELFIENLSQSLSTVLVAKRQSTLNEAKTERSPVNNQIQEESQLNSEESNSSSEEEDIVMQNQEEVIESHEELKQQEQEIRQSLMQQEEQISSLDDHLKSKETLLDAIKESHKMLQNNLLQAMKNEYHKKIQQLDNEIKSLEKERGESLKKVDNAQQKSKLDDLYKKKMKELDEQLKDLKQKDREQNSMIKEANNQKMKIKNMESEIEKMKTQKVTLMKKIKEESEKHRKWKEERVKELIRMKQANLKKDREIDKLKRDNKRKEILAKRKQEELSALQKKSKADKQKQIDAEKVRMKKKNIDVGKIQEWIMSNTEKMLKYKELQSALLQEESQSKEVEDQISEEQSQLAILSIRKEKLEIKKVNIEVGDDEQQYLINEELDQVDIEMKTIQDNIESLEEKLDFINLKRSNINSELINLSPDDIEKLNFSEVQSIEGARTCLGAFFGILLDVNVYKKQLENQLAQMEGLVEEMKLQVEETTKSLLASELNFQNDIEQAKKQNKEREDLLMRIIMENCGSDMEQLLNQEVSPNTKSSNELIREYLRNKENEIQQDALRLQTNTLASTLSALQKKSLIAKQEVKKNKEQIVNQSKTALSKRVAELERQKRDDEKKLESIRHKYEQSNQEKELFKRQLDTMKQKLKTQEIQDIKNQKTYINEEISNQNYQTISKSPRIHSQQSFNPPPTQQQKLLTLNEMRKERKMKKLGSVQPGTVKIMDPKVIADEPMDEEVKDQQVKVEKNLRLNLNEIEQIPKVQVIEPMSTKNQDNEVNVFARLTQNGKGRSSFLIPSTSQSNQPQQQQQQQPEVINQGYDDDHKWKCLISKEQAHNGQICALASVGNQLYSTSNKSLKIWDLDTMTCISDIQAHNSYIKCITIWEDKKLLLTASDKIIMLWDLISLTNVGQLKGHKDEIKAMNISQDGNLLFSAGRGSATNPSLLLWDLRKGAQPYEEREKNQDIFSLASNGDYLFMGCRNHYVYPFNFQTSEIIQPFEPPHFDAVTSLAIIDNTLVSGSRDKNLRCWDYLNLQNKYSDVVMQAHSDWINCLETDYDKKELYSGSKDGIVKIWKIRNKKLKCVASLSNNASSINSLCKIDKQFGKMFAQGSSDKSIRMWKFKEKYLNEQDSLDQQNHEEYIDVNMDEGENNEIENQLFQQQEEQKQEMKIIKQQAQSQQQQNPVVKESKLQQMRRQKRIQENQKRQQKENEVFSKHTNI